MRWFWREPIIVTPPKVEDALVERCLAAEIDGLPIFEAILTVVHAHREDLIDSAGGLLGDHGKLAGNTGGVQTLDWLTEDLLKIRERGRKDV